MQTVDARGLACPGPVLETKKMLESMKEGELEVLVDNEVSRDNVLKLANSGGHRANAEKRAGGYAVTITKSSMLTSGVEGIFSGSDNMPLVVLVKSGVFGSGDDDLGRILMRSFLYTLTELDKDIKAVILMNGGIFLALEGSEVLETLMTLQGRGTEVLVCGTCLDFFEKKNQLRVGSITNMYSSVDYLSMDGVKTIVI